MSEIAMPKMSDTMEEGTIVKWIKHEGDQVTAGEPIAEIETDKANVEMEAFESGVMKQILVQEGETVPVGTAIAMVETSETAAAQPPTTGTPQESGLETPKAEAAEPSPRPLVTSGTERREAPPVQEAERLKASPLARRMAEERGIDLAAIRGTGPNGRIIEADVEAYAQGGTPASAPAAAPVQPPSAPQPAAETPTEERELSKMRKTIARRMSESKRTVPHFYVTVDVDMDWASRVRQELNSLDESQPKVSFTDMIVKASALALARFPEVNASYAEDKLTMHSDVNVAIAVALEDGLLAPVVHSADRKSLREIAAETRQLAERARSNQLRASDLTGATFTVSNLGMYNVESFSSIIDLPQSASLAVGTITEQPVVIAERVTTSKRMKATLSADHRVLDGAKAAEFLTEVKRRLESPTSLL